MPMLFFNKSIGTLQFTLVSMFSSCALVLANRMVRRVAAEISFIFLLAAAQTFACFIFIS
jgi:hypothetical protein